MVIGNLLNIAGKYNNSNAINTMITSTIGYVRAGTVPFDKDATSQEKAQNITWNATQPVVSILFQLAAYKILDPIIKNISLKNLELKPHKEELAFLEKSALEDSLEKLSKSDKNWQTLLKNELVENNTHMQRPSLFKRLKARLLKRELPIEKNVSGEIIEGVEKLAKKLSPKAKKIGKEEVTKALETLKTYKGSNEFMNFAFVVVGLVGYMMPTVVVKLLNPIMKAAHDKIKVNGKPIVPEPKKEDKSKQKSNFTLFGIPLLIGGGALAALKGLVKPDHKIPFTKYTVKQGLTHFGNWDAGLNPNKRLMRTILANTIVRPAAAIIQGKFSLAAYIFAMEGLSLLPTYLMSKVLGSVKSGKGLINKVANKLKVKDSATKAKKLLSLPQKKGLEMIVSHSLQSYLILGAVLGLATNVINKPLAKFFKKIFKEDSVDNKQQRTIFTTASLPLYKHSTNVPFEQLKLNAKHNFQNLS